MGVTVRDFALYIYSIPIHNDIVNKFLRKNLNNRLLDTAKTNADGSISITAYTYDANGNRLSKLNETLTPIGSGAPAVGLDLGGGFELYEYDIFNRQRRANIGGIVTTYIYAASNLRHSKTTGGVMTTHVWDGSNISLDIVDGTATKYVRGIGLISSGDTFYLYNAHGDVVQLTDTAGSVTKSYDYDAFGVERDIDPNDTNPWRYCGEYFDVETGTVYLRARYYQPKVGRFTQEDPYWNTGNMVYGDEPVKWNKREPFTIDVLGLDKNGLEQIAPFSISEDKPDVLDEKQIFFLDGFRQDIQDALGLNTYTYKPDILAIMQSGNLYVYCMSNPIIWHDPTGEFIKPIITNWWNSANRVAPNPPPPAAKRIARDISARNTSCRCGCAVSGNLVKSWCTSDLGK